MTAAPAITAAPIDIRRYARTLQTRLAQAIPFTLIGMETGQDVTCVLLA